MNRIPKKRAKAVKPVQRGAKKQIPVNDAETQTVPVKGLRIGSAKFANCNTNYCIQQCSDCMAKSIPGLGGSSDIVPAKISEQLTFKF